MKAKEFIIDVVSKKKPKKYKVKFRRDGDFTVAISPFTKSLEMMNITASEIFDLCNGKNTVCDIIDIFQKTYPNIDKEEIAFDVIICIRDLESKGFLDTRSRKIEFREVN